jgi:hypothetical protein
VATLKKDIGPLEAEVRKLTAAGKPRNRLNILGNPLELTTHFILRRTSEIT